MVVARGAVVAGVGVKAAVGVATGVGRRWLRRMRCLAAVAEQEAASFAAADEVEAARSAAVDEGEAALCTSHKASTQPSTRVKMAATVNLWLGSVLRRKASVSTESR